MRLLLGLVVVIATAAIACADPVQTFVEAAGPHAALKGTMLSAGSPNSPIVLIIPGSGPTDRDGNSPLGVKASTYRLLAEDLAKKGISTVRIDKRGMFASLPAIADANAVTMADYAADVHSWIAAIRQIDRVPCVWVLGHSEGSLVALIADKNSSDICGLILVSAPGRPMGEVLREQIRKDAPDTPMQDQASKAIDALESGRRVDTANLSPALSRLFRPSIQAILIDAFSYNPAKLIATVKQPVLILQGERDVQVSQEDAQLLKRSYPGANLVLLANTNHVLKTVATDDLRANAATYSDPSLPLAEGISDSIVRFVTSQTRAH